MCINVDNDNVSTGFKKASLYWLCLSSTPTPRASSPWLCTDNDAEKKRKTSVTGELSTSRDFLLKFVKTDKTASSERTKKTRKQWRRAHLQ